MVRKILWIHSNFGFVGGAEHFIFSLVEGLRADYISSIIYSKKCPQTYQQYSKPFSHSFQMDFDVENAEAYEEVQQIIKNENPDLIFIHKCLSVNILKGVLDSKIPSLRMFHDHEVYCLRGSKTFPFSRKICKSKAPLCCFCPGFSFLQREWPFLRWPNFFKHRKLVRLDHNFTLFLAPSKYMQQELIQQGYDPSRIEVLNPTPSLDADYDLSSNFSDENIILFVGQLVRGKGLDCLLKALHFVKNKYRLIVCGSGPEELNCKNLAKELNIEDSVFFMGKVPNQNLKSYYSIASVCVVPSVWGEPFSIVGAEYMLRGLPVVAFDSGGIEEWLSDGKTGFLIPWMDTEKMGMKIDLILSDKKLAREMGEEGRSIAKNRFTCKNSIEKLKLIFNKIVKF